MPQRLFSQPFYFGLLVGLLAGLQGVVFIQLGVRDAWGSEPPPRAVRYGIVGVVATLAVAAGVEIYHAFALQSAARFTRMMAISFFAAAGTSAIAGVVIDVGITLPGTEVHLKKDDAGWFGTLLGVCFVAASVFCVSRYRDDYRYEK